MFVVAAAVEVVRKTGDGKLKYLVNNAGAGIVAPILDTNLDQARQMFDVNYWGPLAMIQAFVPLIKESKGTIANIGSGAGNITFPWVGELFSMSSPPWGTMVLIASQESTVRPKLRFSSFPSRSD